jgi:hypothetical protein
MNGPRYFLMCRPSVMVRDNVDPPIGEGTKRNRKTNNGAKELDESATAKWIVLASLLNAVLDDQPGPRTGGNYYDRKRNPDSNPGKHRCVS